MDKRNYGMLLIVVSVIVAVVYTFWVPLSYLLNDGKEPLILKDILPPPIWGIIIPVFLLMLFTTFIFSWIGWNILHAPPQEETSLKDLEGKRAD
ncbi:MAG: hypothetical protein C4526_02250 [Nitrospiraceae bacterium]|nr:MAG: hypothetical protein C4526_02250 [Nitrospiraceae bacterium]